MKCHILFSEKNKKNISKCRLLKILPRVLSVKTIAVVYDLQMIQHTTKPAIRLVRPAKAQISLRIRAALSESLLIACILYSLQAIQRGINKNPCHTGRTHRLI